MDDHRYWLRYLLQPHPFLVLHNGEDGNGGGGDNGDGTDDDEDGDDDDDDDGDGDGDGTGDDDDEDDADAAYDSLLKKYKGNVEKTAQKLTRRNFALRKTNRDLTAELGQYKKHGKPKEIATAIRDRKELQLFKTKTVRREGLLEVAEVAEYDHVVLYEQMPESVECFVELEGEEGKKTKVAKVKYKDGENTKTESLHDYAKVHMERYLPALEKTKDNSQGKGRKGSQMSRQTAQGDDANVSHAASYLKSQYAPSKKET